MSALRIGSLCSGYGGLDMAVESFFGAETAWFSEFDAAPSRILEARWPGVPNLGDMTAIDWSSVPKVDIVCGGTPCQDLSTAGRRRGMTEGTRSNLWVQMRECIAAVKPSIVVWENVRGAYSARAASDVELEPGLLGEFADRPALRALGRVLGDLSDLGFDAEVVGVRAADAGAPHPRFRVFVVAYTHGAGLGSVGRFRAGERDSDGRRSADPDGQGGEPTASAEDTDGAAGDQRRVSASGQETSGGSRADAGGSDRARTELNLSVVRRGGYQTTTGQLLPTPAAHDSGNTPEEHLRKKPGRKVVTSLQVMADHGLIPNGGVLLQTPVASEGTKGTFAPFEDVSGSQEFLTNQIASVHRDGTWGPYTAAIARWETALGRPAPSPTLPDGKGGKHRLNARLVEWMMGLPEGWVTDPEIGIRRNDQLKALGNGVVPQQATLALSIAWSRVLESLEVAA